MCGIAGIIASDITTAEPALYAMRDAQKAVRQKLADMVLSDGSLLQLYLYRRRAMSDDQLSALGSEPKALGLAEGLQLPETLSEVEIRDDDPIWTISQLESRFYQGNMLLRDGDVNGMAHSLEIRVPILDQRMLNLAYSLPGPVRLPTGRNNKHLLRTAFANLLRPELTQQKKRGFTLPIRRWMIGPLRDLCEHALTHLKSLSALKSPGIDSVWQAFLNDPESPIWSRAFSLCVLGLYTERMNVRS